VQVANQQGEYLARELNTSAAAKLRAHDLGPTAVAHEPKPFVYKHLGSFASLGSEQARRFTFESSWCVLYYTTWTDARAGWKCIQRAGAWRHRLAP